MSVSFKPLSDRILVEPAPVEQKTKSGIIIPDSAKNKSSKGVVVSVGPGKKDESMTLKPGDLVLYDQYAGSELKLEDKMYLIMKQSDVLGIVQ